MAKKKSHPVQMKKKNSLYVGRINSNELFINRKGEPNSGTHPELRTKVHKSKKVYDRNRGKRELRNQLNKYGF